jgi:hypothetical protein
LEIAAEWDGILRDWVEVLSGEWGWSGVTCPPNPEEKARRVARATGGEENLDQEADELRTRTHREHAE